MLLTCDCPGGDINFFVQAYGEPLKILYESVSFSLRNPLGNFHSADQILKRSASVAIASTNPRGIILHICHWLRVLIQHQIDLVQDVGKQSISLVGSSALHSGICGTGIINIVPTGPAGSVNTILGAKNSGG